VKDEMYNKNITVLKFNASTLEKINIESREGKKKKSFTVVPE